MRMANTAEQDILPQLIRFRELQKKAVQTIKSDVKTESREYNELRWIQIAKLKKAYELKSEELEKAMAKFAAKGEQSLHDGDGAFGEIPEQKKWLNLGMENVGSKTFRLTEELKQCDQAYRYGVLSLEDKRYKLQEAVDRGFGELERLEKERLQLCREACSKYSRIQESTIAKDAELSKKTSSLVEAIRTEADLQHYRGEIRQAWIGPDVVSYEKYGFGKLKDMTFGLDLERHVQSKRRQIPLVVEKCVKTLDRRGLDREGLYRVPALASAVATLRTKHEQDETVDFDVIPEAEDVNVVAALLKLYIRELPQALFSLSDKDRAEYSRMTDPGQRMIKLRYLMRAQPQINQMTLKCIVDHLCRVAMNSHQNRMTISSLATIFGAIIFNSVPLDAKVLPSGSDKKSMSTTEAATAAAELFKADCVIVEDLCNWHAFIFESAPAVEASSNLAAIPPRRDSSQRSMESGSPTTPPTGDRSKSAGKPARVPGSDRQTAQTLDAALRAMVLTDSRGPMAMP
ncbi:Rho GTPase activation protein [Hyaloraphidium curvatum]|nr:Rho GTPase activation protein [Hyaloraphidium curvatum]